MTYQLTQGEQNLAMLAKSLPERDSLFLWCYSSSSGLLLASSCPYGDVIHAAFSGLGGVEKALDYAAQNDSAKPMIIGTSIGLQWAITLEKERNPKLIFLLGPVFFQADLKESVEDKLGEIATETISWKQGLLETISKLPVMSYAVFSRYAALLHNTINGEKIEAHRLEGGEASLISARAFGQESQQERFAAERDRTKVYQAERVLLQMVRSGDINYQSALQNSMLLSSGVPVRSCDPLRPMKTSLTVFISLVCRAAIEGGLIPELSYPLGDSYIQTAEDCNNAGELSALAQAMYHDFIYRVHYCRTNPRLSHAIQKCCDYIALSLDKKIRAADLAALVGYSEYYLTEKFKKETGLTATKYILLTKLERGRMLLISTDMPVNAIATGLAFSTSSFFIQRFRETTGFTPEQYRKKYKWQSTAATELPVINTFSCGPVSGGAKDHIACETQAAYSLPNF